MFQSVGICILILVACSTGPSLARLPTKNEPNDRSIDSQGNLVRERTKRVAPIIGKAVVAGIKATKTLLRGAEKVPSKNQLQHEYVKQGGYLQAVKDFYSVQPSHVQYFENKNMVFGKVGVVGDTSILVQGRVINGKASKPILKIFKSEDANNPDAFYDIITYTGNLVRERTKRVAPIIGNAIATGIKATKFLLRGAGKLPSKNPFQQEYVKHGGYMRAIKDFYSVEPSRIQYFEHTEDVFGKIGVIGDKSILVQARVINGKVSNPTLKIFKTEDANRPDAFFDIITYMYGPR